jgi:uncharacterized protein
VFTLARFQSTLRQVLHLRESPRRTALAFAVGVFLTFSPPYGLHMLIAAFCAWWFGLNYLAVFLGLSINNPWTLVPVLGFTFWIGSRLLGMPDPPPFDWSDLGFMALYHQVMPYALPFVLGSTILSLLGALLAYPAAYFFITKHRHTVASPELEPLPPHE